MKQNNRGAMRPQNKIINVNRNFGNPGLAKQQGSTVEIYDLVEIATNQLSYDFFINAKNKNFPLTNLIDGKLQPQESLAMERMYFTLVSFTEATATWSEVRRLDLLTDPGFAMGEMEFQIENQRVLKPIPMRSFFPEFNATSDSINESVFEFDTQIVIPPLLSFKATVKLPPNFLTVLPVGVKLYLACSIGGAGGIFAPKSNY